MISLLSHNTFGIDCSCNNLLEPTTMDELNAIVPRVRKSSAFLVIGAGSNLLLTKDYDGDVVHVCIKGMEIVKDEADYGYIRCGAGETFDDVIPFAISHGFYGMENLSLIPGEVGASAVQNIGAYGREVKDFISDIEAIDLTTGEDVTIKNADCHYAYRYSRFKDEWKQRYLIHHVTYKVPKTYTPSLEYGKIREELEKQGITTPTAMQVRNVIIDIRNEKLPDPKVEGNAGSFFMNPIVDKQTFEALLKEYPTMPHYPVDADHEKLPAGWLIDQCGWKGKTMGKAGVHGKQALVLVNKGGATGSEIVALCEAIQQDVKQKFGVTIKPEVNII